MGVGVGGSFVSVVIPARNRANVIGRAVASVAAQTHPAGEIIVVDDASTDDTGAVVNALAAHDPRIRLVPLAQRHGAPGARNKGAAAASGALLAFLDSDDLWRPGKLAAQVALLDAEPGAPAAFTGISYRYLDRPPFDAVPPGRVELADLFGVNVLGTCSSALVRRDAFHAIGGFAPDLPSCQDWDLWLRLADHGPLLVAPAPLTEYCFDGGGRISVDAGVVIRGHAAVHRAILARIGDPVQRRAVAIAHARGLAVLLSRRTFAPRAALTNAVFALRAQPDGANARLLAETALRIGVRPIEPTLRRLQRALRRAPAVPTPPALNTHVRQP
jgi:glycosyltransferase involved in cell wall biosynthesis